MKLLVTGASGLLGLNLAVMASRLHQVTGLVHSHPLNGAPFTVRQEDLCEPGAAEQLLKEVQPDAVIHCAAMALLDECEADPQRAWMINAELPGKLAGAAKKAGCRFVTISTDGVFDGRGSHYREEDTPNPLSTYARTKLAGEQAALQANPAALVVRSNFYGWSLRGTRSLAEHFFYNLQAGRRVYGFTDVIFCPLLVNTLAAVLLDMVEANLGGIYHVFSKGSLTKYEFGVALAKACGLRPELIEPAVIGASGLKAARSPNLEMCSDKVEAALGITLPGPAGGLADFYELYRQGYSQRLLAMGN